MWYSATYTEKHNYYYIEEKFNRRIISKKIISELSMSKATSDNAIISYRNNIFVNFANWINRKKKKKIN